MAEVKVRDLIDLAVGEHDRASSHLTQIFLWRYEQAMTMARSLATTGSAVLVALALALAQDEAEASSVAVRLGLAGAVLVILAGGVTAWRARAITKQYVAAQFLLSELQTIRPFLRLYLFGGTKP